MNWARKHHVETLAEWCAPLLLAVSAGWAAWVAGLPLAAVAAVGVVALAIGVVVMRLAGQAPNAVEPGFEPVPIEEAVSELDELLLDDPLIEIAPESRVVRLFAKPDPTPGDLVLRIEDYLSEGRRSAPPEAPVEQRPVDASAALHAALANIRASLR